MAKKNQKPRVGIVMGSDSDLPIMSETARTLQQLEIPYEIEINSAHRSPERTSNYARSAAGRGIKVIIAGAGGAFHLAGVIAAQTTLPVIGVPIPGPALGGLDALLSAVQMPGGVPVGVMALGKAGAINAAVFAAQIMAGGDDALALRLLRYKEDMRRAVAQKNDQLKKQSRSGL